MEKLRKIFSFIIVASFGVFIIYAAYDAYRGKMRYIDREYVGIISEIRTLPGSRDIPDIKINDKWIILEMLDSKVKNYIQIGDSIVKKSGSTEIRVFKKSKSNEWYVRLFK